jgi:hypothetical protein
MAGDFLHFSPGQLWRENCQEKMRPGVSAGDEKRSRRIRVATLQPAPHTRHLLDLQRGGGERILHIEFSGWTRGSEHPSPCMLSRDISATLLGFSPAVEAWGFTHLHQLRTQGGKMSRLRDPEIELGH